MDVAYLYILLYLIVQSFGPLFIKKNKRYLFFNNIVNTFVIFIFSCIHYFYNTKDTSFITNINTKTLIPGFLSQFSVILVFYAISILPSYIAIPMTTLGIVSISIFDRVLNKTKYTPLKYIQILLILVGIIVINYKHIRSKEKTEFNIIGVLFLIISSVITGYLYTFLRNYTIKENNPNKTIILQYKGSILFLFFYIVYTYVFNKKDIVRPPLKYFFGFILFLTFIISPLTYLNIDAISKLPQLQSAIFSNLSVIFSLIISVIYFKEKLNKSQFIGIILIFSSILLTIIY